MQVAHNVPTKFYKILIYFLQNFSFNFFARGVMKDLLVKLS